MAFLKGGLVREDELFAFARVLGLAAASIAETAVALFYSEPGLGGGDDGAGELVRAKATEEAIVAFGSVPELFTAVLRAQVQRAARRTMLARTEVAGSPSPSEPTGEAGPSAVVALGFVDLVGSTAWAEELTLRDQSLALARFESVAWSSAVLAEGRVVKMIGDEVFFVAPNVDAACRIAIEVCRAVALDPLLPPARGAVGYGQVAAREGDYFGPLVNLVARLVKVAVPGSVVVTEEAAAAASPDRWALVDLGPQQVRGIEHPVAAFAVSDGERSSA
jgi:adenylate cyclase